MVLKDVACDNCGRTQEAVLSGVVTSIILRCAACSAETNHTSCCNGGKAVFGINFQHRDFGDDIKLIGFGGGNGPDEDHLDPLVQSDGTSILDKQNNEDVIAERRDYVKTTKRIAHGGAKLTFHG